MKINELVKGQTPTLIEADKGNELIRAINALLNLTVRRGAKDQLIVSSHNAILELKADNSSGGEISGNEYNLLVCENGSAVQKTFYVK